MLTEAITSHRLYINREFGLLWSASFISQTGDMIYAIALAWMILERTHSPALMGLYLVASHLPGFLISPWVGTIIDRSDRKRILVAADLVRGAVVGLASVVVLTGGIQIWHILAVSVVLSVASAFFNPTARVVIPRLVPDDRLVTANASMQFIAGATSVAGPLLGAVLLGVIGYFGAFLANALSFLLSGSLILLLGHSLAEERAAAAPDRQEGVRAGLRFIGANPRLLVVLVIIFCVHIFYGSLAVVLPFLANTLSGTGIVNLGMMEAALGGGMLAASVALNVRRRDPDEGVLFRVIIALGIGILAMGGCRFLGVAVPLPYVGSLLAIGVSVCLASVLWTTLMQRGVPGRIAGRVFAMSSAIGEIALPLAYGAFGVLMRAVSLTAILTGCGLVVVSVGVVAGLVFASSEWNGLEACPPDTANGSETARV